MARARSDLFGTIRTEGVLLPPELLRRVADLDTGLKGLDPASYHLGKGERLQEAINRSWNRLVGVWATYSEALAKLPETEPAIGLTREKWLLILFHELGFGRLQASRSVEINGKSYPVSHEWQHVPIHLVGAGVPLDRRSERVAGAARFSPHGMVQELLNASDDRLWGIVSNGHLLRILRDNSSLTRQAYVEFDLKSMMDGEVFSDFGVLWLLAHQSRFEGTPPEECWLQKWSAEAEALGTRALDDLRKGVEEALAALGRGFLAHPANVGLRDLLRTGRLTEDDYYRQLLRLGYRLIFLLVAEDRDALHPPDTAPEARARYRDHYSMTRLRRMADRRRGTAHPDLWLALQLVMDMIGSTEGCPPLGLPALGSQLWNPESIPAFRGCQISNRDLLEALRALAFKTDGNFRRPVDYRNMGPEEFGSIYESLLELHAEINTDAGLFSLTTAAGNQRKTTGSYYTPTSLISVLLDSALDPVLDEAGKQPDPEAALLALKIVDPACGSGHFLIAAGHRLARRVATLRTGDDQPAPEAIRSALRDVIGRCIYGVDQNAMAVELCKINLWMEALVPGRPLSFLDHHIRCGNSLIGTTPALMAGGIPDEAFSPIEGDEKAVVSSLKKQNKKERPRAGGVSQSALILQAAEPTPPYGGGLASEFTALSSMPDDDIAAIQTKEQRFLSLVRSRDYNIAHLQADAWCAAFVWRKVLAWRESAVTQNVFLRLLDTPDSVPEPIRTEVAHLADQYQFFHWHLAFPDVFTLPEGAVPHNTLAGWNGGFDVVLGNPPWERIKIQEKEWFAQKRPDIANAPNAAARTRLIDKLETDEPALHAAFLHDRRKAEGESHFVRDSGRFPLCGRGDVNTYTIFAETNRLLVSPRGRVGIIVPSGIATDDTTKYFFQDIMNSRSLVSLFDFENREGIFPAVDSRMKFCLLTLAGADSPARTGAEFVFFAHRVEDLDDPERRFNLSAEDIALLNPNTRTCPVFRTRRDAEITKGIYRRVPILIREGPPEENPWGITFMAMFHMSNDSPLFRTREQLEGEGWVLEGNVFHGGGERYLPLYEAKMVHHFDHRWATYEGLDTRDVTAAEKARPDFAALPRYWVPESEVEERLAGRWDKGWLLGWRDITNTTNERTVIAGVVPRVGVGNKIPLMFVAEHAQAFVPGLIAALSSHVFDYASRQKVGGTTLNFFIYKQLPVCLPDTYGVVVPWDPATLTIDWITARVVELTFSAADQAPFARDLRYEGPPFKWDPERRFQIRCELDAAFFHLYGIDRDDVDYIMDTFPIVRRHDEAEYGGYLTKERILQVYDAMSHAIQSGESFKSHLVPSPGVA